MPIFAYEAHGPDGQKRVGEITAPDRNAAIQEIRGAGLRPTKVAERQDGGKKSRGKAEEAPTPTSATGTPAKKIRGKVKSIQLATFASQFAVLQDAGLPIVRSLKVLSQQEKPGPFKSVLEQVANSVESGSTLSDAMAQHPKAFDNLFTNMVRAGEAGGVLDTIMNRLAGFLEKAQRLKKKVVGASIYPIVVMSVAILILTAIVVFVVPSFEAMFTAQGMALPVPTQILLGASKFLGGIGGLAIIAGVVVLIVLFRLYKSTSGGKRTIDAIIIKVPIFGTIIRKSTTSRFCRTLGTLITSGVPILESLAICRAAINNEILGEAIESVRSSIKEGESIAAPLSKTSLFDDIVVNMIDVGEETGELDKMLIKVADNYDLEVDIAVESLMSVMEPVLIVFMGSAIGFIVVALFMPLVSMIENIGT